VCFADGRKREGKKSTPLKKTRPDLRDWRGEADITSWPNQKKGTKKKTEEEQEKRFARNLSIGAAEDGAKSAVASWLPREKKKRTQKKGFNAPNPWGGKQ